MKSWLELSLGLPFCAAAYTLVAKEGVTVYDPLSYVSYGLLGASVLSLVYSYSKGVLAAPNAYSILGGLAVGGAVIAQAIAIDSAPNAGLASSVFRSQSGLTVLAAVALLHGELDVVALGAVLVTLAGVYLATTGRQTSDERTAEQHRHVQQQRHTAGAEPGKGWVKAALIAAGLLTVKDLLAVMSVRSGLEAESAATVEIVVATIVAIAYKRYKTGTLELVAVDKALPPPWWVLPAGSVVMALWPTLVITAMAEAPNSGYPKALALSGVAISALMSSYIYNEPLTDRAWSGIGLIILGTAGLMLRGV